VVAPPAFEQIAPKAAHQDVAGIEREGDAEVTHELREPGDFCGSLSAAEINLPGNIFRRYSHGWSSRDQLHARQVLKLDRERRVIATAVSFNLVVEVPT